MLLKSSKSLVFDAAILNGFPLFKRSADVKTFICLWVAFGLPGLPRRATSPSLPVCQMLAFEHWKQVHHQITSKQASQTKITRRKTDKWLKILTLHTVSYSEITFISGKSAYLSFMVFVSSCVFFPKSILL